MKKKKPNAPIIDAIKTMRELDYERLFKGNKRQLTQKEKKELLDKTFEEELQRIKQHNAVLHKKRESAECSEGN